MANNAEKKVAFSNVSFGGESNSSSSRNNKNSKQSGGGSGNSAEDAAAAALTAKQERFAEMNAKRAERHEREQATIALDLERIDHLLSPDMVERMHCGHVAFFGWLCNYQMARAERLQAIEHARLADETHHFQMLSQNCTTLTKRVCLDAWLHLVKRQKAERAGHAIAIRLVETSNALGGFVPKAGGDGPTRPLLRIAERVMHQNVAAAAAGQDGDDAARGGSDDSGGVLARECSRLAAESPLTLVTGAASHQPAPPQSRASQPSPSSGGKKTSPKRTKRSAGNSNSSNSDRDDAIAPDADAAWAGGHEWPVSASDEQLTLATKWPASRGSSVGQQPTSLLLPKPLDQASIALASSSLFGRSM